MAVSVVSYTTIASTFLSPTTPRNITGLAWSAGNVVVVAGAAENAGLTLGTPTNANLTFGAAQTSQTTGGAGETAIWIWATVAGSSQSAQTIACSRTAGGGDWGAAAWVLTGCSGTFANVTSNRTEAGIVFTPSAGSAVIYFFADWSANTSNQTITAGTGTATERVDDGNGVTYGVYGGDWVNVTASSTTFGVTSYTSLQISHAVIEILAPAAAPTTQILLMPARSA